MAASKPLAHVFAYCPACGVAIPTPGASPLCCPDGGCGFRFFFGPVTAVGAIVHDEAGRVLFVRRANDPEKGKLGLPGGFVDAGETLEGAVEREVREETNLTLAVSRYLTSQPNRYVYRGAEIDVTDMFFDCQVESFDGMTAVDGEVSEFLLLKPTEDVIDQMAFVSNQRAVELWVSGVQ